MNQNCLRTKNCLQWYCTNAHKMSVGWYAIFVLSILKIQNVKDEKPTDILCAFVQWHCRQFLVRRQFWFITLYSLYVKSFTDRTLRITSTYVTADSLFTKCQRVYIYVYKCIYIYIYIYIHIYIPPDILWRDCLQ